MLEKKLVQVYCYIWYSKGVGFMRMQNSWYNVFNKTFYNQYGPLQLYKTDDQITDLLLMTEETS